MGLIPGTMATWKELGLEFVQIAAVLVVVTVHAVAAGVAVPAGFAEKHFVVAVVGPEMGIASVSSLVLVKQFVPHVQLLRRDHLARVVRRVVQEGLVVPQEIAFPEVPAVDQTLHPPLRTWTPVT